MSATPVDAHSPNDEIATQLTCLWEPDDLIEIRAFGEKSTPVQEFYDACETAAIVEAVRRLDERHLNVCAGVAPRSGRGGKATDIACFRSVYADIDGCSIEEAQSRLLRTTLPPPTLVIASGHGVHFYWRLIESIPVERSVEIRDLIHAIARLLSADEKVKDAARVMRLAGTTNWKNLEEPIPCRIVEAHPERRAGLGDFDEAIRAVNAKKPPTRSKSATKKPRRVVAPPTRDFVENGAEPGDRNDRLFAAACDMAGHGWNYDDALNELLPTAEEIGLSEQEARATIDSAFSHPRCPDPTSGDCTEGMPTVIVNGRQFPSIVVDAWKAILTLNRTRKIMFNRHGVLVRIVNRPDGQSIEVVDQVALYGLLARSADWVKRLVKGLGATRPPKDIAPDMLAFVDRRVPRLDLTVQAPCYSASGDLIVTPGYHESAGVYYFDTQKLTVPDVPRSPTDADIAEARRMILDEMFGEFEFQNQASRAHAVGALLLPFIRAMIDGATPLHVVGARHPGSGKGLLCDCISIVTTGRRSEVQTLPQCEDEFRKRITSILIEGPPIVLLDNLPTNRSLNSASLAAAITARIWVDRLLGVSKNVRLANNPLWMLTGNSPKFTTELSRRSVRIFLDPKTDRPWERNGFRHPDLLQWVVEHRSDLVRAVLILVQAWIDRGRKPSAKNLGSFETWAHIVGGILEVAGIDGFLGDRNVVHEDLDSESAEWREFVAAWDEKFGAAEKSVKDLLQLCDGSELLSSVIRGELPKARETSLGRQLVQRTNSVIGAFVVRVVTGAPKKHGRRYQVVRSESGASGGTSHQERGTSATRGSTVTNREAGESYTTTGNLGNLPPAETRKIVDDVDPGKVADDAESMKSGAFDQPEVPEVPHADPTHFEIDGYDRGTSESGGSPDVGGGSLFRGFEIDEDTF